MRVTVVYHAEPDGIWAELPQVEPWAASAPTLDELQLRVEECVRLVLEDDGVDASRVEIVRELP